MVQDTDNNFVDYTKNTALVDARFLIEQAEKAGVFVTDLETTGLNPKSDNIEGIAIYVPGLNGAIETGAWFPFVSFTFMCHNANGELLDLRPALDAETTIESIRPLWEKLTSTICIFHNAKFDMAFLKFSPAISKPIEINNILADSMLADYCTDERRKRYGLKHRVKQEFGHTMTTYNDAVRGQSSLAFCDAKPLGLYAVEDCMWTYKLHAKSLEKLRQQSPDSSSPNRKLWSIEQQLNRRMGRLERIYWGIDTKIARIIMEMETSGVLIDWRWLRKVEDRLNKEKDEISSRMEAFLGWPINPNSNKQVADALFAEPPDGIGLCTIGVPRGKTGDLSTSDKVIKHFNRFHPLVADILKWRSLDTLLGSFVKKLIGLSIESPDGRVYAHFNQTGTVIGRLSCLAHNTILDTNQGPIQIGKLEIDHDNPHTIRTHLNRHKRILKKFYKGEQQLIKITISDNRSLECTRDHVLLAKAQNDKPSWTKVIDLKVGNQLRIIDKDFDGYLTILKMDPTIIDEVWDIEVEDDASFITNGFVNHNSSDPINFQNQPRDKNLVRKAYCSVREGLDNSNNKLYGGDLGQIELRIAAHLANEKNMIEVYSMNNICKAENGLPCERFQYYECHDCDKKGIPHDNKCKFCGSTNIEHQSRCRHVDLHQRTSEDVGIPRNPLSKNCNFGLAYRMGAAKFCVYADLFDADGLPMIKYAQSIVDKWFEAYPGIVEFHDRIEYELPRNNWIAETLFGRRRRLDQESRINRYKAVTQGIQFMVSGSAQDLMKAGMIRIYEERNKNASNGPIEQQKLWRRVKMLLQIHDEIVLEGPAELEREILEMMKRNMESIGKGSLSVPISFSCRSGKNWDDIH